ncbi:BMP family ABC transporter substrate-binding protein [Streptomyces scopuliridis]|uniref:BMP family ABC transporter substrate-binding protein n=1 Tax=Streptomyces scopuliridis TaxID=452529 RepID=UPI0036BAE509
MAALGLLGLLAFQLLGGSDPVGPPDPRARQYEDEDACLLTDDQGIASGTPAALVWQAMQKASLDTRARVNYVPVTGEQSVANARPFFNALMQRQCGVVLAVGGPQVEVTEAGAARHPNIRFVVVDGASDAANVVVVKSGEGLEETVVDAIQQVVKGR